MYDICDVLHASYGSADIINHVLCDYGEGNMGNGIRKLAGEILMATSRESYENGFEDGYNTELSNGILKGSIITSCLLATLVLGAWGTNKLISIYKEKKVKEKISNCN